MLLWRHNERDGVSNHRRFDCLFNHFQAQIKEISKHWPLWGQSTGHNPLVNIDIHYIDVIMSVMASQITSISIVYWTVCSGGYQRKYQSSTSLAFVRGNHRGPVDSPHKGPVTQKKYPIDDVIMYHDKIMRNINVVIFYGIYCISLSSPSAMTIDSRFSG